jgi:hypothetical protein
MGVNKVNYFVTRTLDRDIVINTDGTRSESVTTVIRNGSGSQDKNLPYRAYIRFVLPPGASVSGVSVDGAAVASETAAVASGFTTAGVALDVLPSTEKRLVVSYTENQPLSFGSSGAVLDVFTQKQPGVSGEEGRTTIRYPASWTAGIEERRAGSQTRDFIAKPGQLEYNTTLTRDTLTRIRFTK